MGGRDLRKRIDMRTEIDLVFENIFVEAKLTENDFTQADLEKGSTLS